MRFVSLSILIALVLWPGPALAERSARADGRPWYAGRLDFTTGVDYRTGDYGRSEDTDILFVPFSLRYRFQELPLLPKRDELRMRVGVPYVNVEGPERGNASNGDRGTDDGVGDLSLRVTYVHRPSYNAWSRKWLPHVYLSERVKFPIASESKNLGTGEFDFTTGAALRKSIRIWDGAWFHTLKPFVTAGYKVVGEPPGEDRDDSFRFGAGSSVRVTDALDVGVRYAYRESTIPGRGNFEIVSPYLGYRFTSWLRVSPYAIFGVSNRSPDWGTGLSIRFTQAVE